MVRVTVSGEDNQLVGNRAVFLDRDGVLNRSIVKNGKPYAPRTFKDFEVYGHAEESLALIRKMGFKTIVVTNQPDVGNGLMHIDELNKMHNFLLDAFGIDRIMVCCHSQGEKCRCRKPMPGMLLDIEKEFELSMADSWLIGDRDSDIGAGIAAGVKTVFVDHNYKEPLNNNPDYVVSDLLEAATLIKKKSNNRSLVYEKG